MSWYNNDNWYKPNYTQSASSASNIQRPEAKLPGGRRTRIIALILCAALLLGGIIYAIFETDWDSASENEDGMPKSYQTYFEDFYSSASSTPANVKLEKLQNRGSLSLKIGSGSAGKLSFNEIFENCSPSVVGIKSFDGKGDDSYSWGSGIIVSADGYILTNTHVIDEGTRATVQLYDGSTYDAKLVGADSQSDVAILKIEKTGLQPAVFASSKDIRVGDAVCAIGNPLSPDYSLTMTSGIISATSREVSYNGAVMNLLQTDTSINEGNSGGPLFNERGQVIGITNMKIVSSFSNIEGIGFAIPSDTLSSIVDALMADGAVYGRSTIGVTVGPISEDIADYYDIPVGLYVSEVLKNSDAQKQGIKKGDIIIKVNGKDAHTTADIAEEKAKLDIGDTISFTVWRSGSTFDVDVKIMDSVDIYNAK
ncbi:MAG: trypsin-like peptidase domain-containing protein [Oscillospiraceae bacterium]|nr:trypsin-like peptidase domain-containing protein [Oscillospiraceae bacterium]